MGDLGVCVLVTGGGHGVCVCAGNRWEGHGVCVLVTGGRAMVYVCAGNRWEGHGVCMCW